MLRQSQTPRWIYSGLLAATAYVFLGEVHGIFEVLARRDELNHIVPAAYGQRMLLRPFVISALALFGWWRFFRHEREGARAYALVGALFLLMTSIVMWLSMQVSDWHYPLYYRIGYPVCALAYLLYVIGGREQ